MKRALALCGLAETVLATLVTCNACSNSGSVDAGVVVDTPSDSSRDREVVKDVSTPDAGPGWRAFSELPGCDAIVPMDPAATMKKLAWIACPSGKPECQRFDTAGWREDMLPGVINSASVSVDKKWLSFVRPLTTGKTHLAEWDLYSRTNFDPINAWVWENDCLIQPILGESRLTLLGVIFTTSPPKFAYANGPMPVTASQPTFLTFQPQPKYVWVDTSASDTKLAFGISYGVGVDTVNAGETTFTSATGTKLFHPLVVGSDVFAWNEYGATGWSRELRVNADGTSTVFREVQGRHVSHFRSDGSTWFWVESYGDANYQNFDQPMAQVWSAPYTNDPSTLAGSAKKLAQVDGASTYNGTEVAFDGYFAVGPRSGPYMWIVRASDGAMKKLDIGALYGPGPMGVPTLGMQQPAFVSKDEVWGVLCGAQGSPNDLAFARFQLGSWP